MSCQPCGCDPEAGWVCRCHGRSSTAIPDKPEVVWESIVRENAPSKAAQLLEEIGLEFDLATKHHPPIASLHEGYAIILEELDELKAEVWKNPKKHPDRQALARKEAIQVAAMALRLLHDVL